MARPVEWSRRLMWQEPDETSPLASRQRGDRVLLPPAALSELEPLMQQVRSVRTVAALGDLPHAVLLTRAPSCRVPPYRPQGQPLTFEVTVAGRPLDAPEHKAYIGVLEFSAPEDKVVLPAALAAQLHMTPSDLVTVRRVELPKGTFARLEPLSAAYKRVPDFRYVHFALRK